MRTYTLNRLVTFDSITGSLSYKKWAKYMILKFYEVTEIKDTEHLLELS